MMDVEKNKEFIKDACEFLRLKYNVEPQQFKNNMLINDSYESFLYRELGQFVFKNLYLIGKEEYHVTLSYEKFLVAIFDGYRVPPRSLRKWFRVHNCEPSKYTKKPHHHKKEKTIEEINKERWRKSQKKKTNKGRKWDFDYMWKDRKMKNELKSDTCDELKDFLDDVNIDARCLKISF